MHALLFALSIKIDQFSFIQCECWRFSGFIRCLSLHSPLFLFVATTEPFDPRFFCVHSTLETSVYLFRFFIAEWTTRCFFQVFNAISNVLLCHCWSLSAFVLTKRFFFNETFCFWPKTNRFQVKLISRLDLIPPPNSIWKRVLHFFFSFKIDFWSKISAFRTNVWARWIFMFALNSKSLHANDLLTQWTMNDDSYLGPPHFFVYRMLWFSIGAEQNLCLCKWTWRFHILHHLMMRSKMIHSQNVVAKVLKCL